MAITIEKVDQSDERVRHQLLELLAPQEAQNLFILGNLATNFPDSHIYVAAAGEKWLGVAAYYAIPKSLIPFSEYPEVVAALTRHIVPLHPRIEWVCGMAAFAGPVCRELESMGYRLANKPGQVFMEMEGVPTFQKHEELARPMRPSDIENHVRLMRHMRGAGPEDAPVTEEEKIRAAGTSSL